MTSAADTREMVADEPERSYSLGERISDRCNPILVREVQQAVKGRMFAAAVGLSLLAIIILALVIATQGDISAQQGLAFFSVTLSMLAPVVLFVVPMQAFMSMRQEMRAGTVEQLMMTNLRPRRIVFGKLASAMVLFFLYLAIFAPMLSLNFFLQGVDLATIAFSLLASFLFCLLATAFAIAGAAHVPYAPLRPFAHAAVAFALGWATLGAIVGMWNIVRELSTLFRSSYIAETLSVLVLSVLSGVVLLSMVAASMLTHGHENRSTPFRLFAVWLLIGSFGWSAVFINPADFDEVGPGLALFVILVAAAVGMFAVTEQAGLSPRARLTVPKNQLLAFAIAPFLPGRNRGLWFTVSLGIAGAALGAAFAVFGAGGPVSGALAERFWRVVYMTGMYCVIFLCLGKTVRALMPATPKHTYRARVSVPLLLVLAMTLPLLFDVLFQGGMRRWHALHILNPIWTIEQFARRGGREILIAIGVIAGGLLLLHLPAMVASVNEVLKASRANRRRGHGTARLAAEESAEESVVEAAEETATGAP